MKSESQRRVLSFRVLEYLNSVYAEQQPLRLDDESSPNKLIYIGVVPRASCITHLKYQTVIITIENDYNFKKYI